ncbi:MAG TPA: thioesterase family protein [Gemmatimonadales bacterium]|nr:thioesterase family protein [Gemmatimonadales bacterium]
MTWKVAVPEGGDVGYGMRPTEVEQVVYPDDCDAFGHLNQAAFLRVFERARWDVMSRGGEGEGGEAQARV